jgi:hypothetical protein
LVATGCRLWLMGSPDPALWRNRCNGEYGLPCS